MKNIQVIGDVHGKVNEYYKILEKHNSEFSIQVGDFGFKKGHEWFLENVDWRRHKILFGNHDDYGFLHAKHSLGDWYYSHQLNHLLCVRGANSIDKQHRIEGRSYWKNEELQYHEMCQVIELYATNNPSIMITHDCPQSIREKVFGIYDKSITSQGLQTMLDIHNPKLWIFGHHHKSIKIMINDVKFICLNELETYNLEI